MSVYMSIISQVKSLIMGALQLVTSSQQSKQCIPGGADHTALRVGGSPFD